MPLEFWGDCVTTATYLINRLPSSVVGNITPYEILLKKKLVYDHLRVFGCFAMVSNPSRTTDKFDPRGVPCVFLVQKDLVNFKEAVADLGWCTAMDVELKALDENSSWELTSLSAGKKAIGSHWIFKQSSRQMELWIEKRLDWLCRVIDRGMKLINKRLFAPVAQKC
ncbi:retrovirus-related pol polyprotein from transposon TNT 1-94 [Tanacetum coccineum]